MKRFFKKAWQLFCAAISYSLFGLGIIVVGLVFRVLDWAPGIASQHKQRWIRRVIHWGCLTFIRWLKLLRLIRYTFNLDPIQPVMPGRVIIANHPSLIDVVLLFAAYKDITCIVKGSLWDNFFTGAVVRLAGFIPNNTEHALTLAVEKLERGEHVLIFPEGTRRDNADPVCFKRGAANIAVNAKVDILPILIKCYPSALKKDDKWYNIPDGGPTFTLISGDLIQLTQCVDSTTPRTLQYRQLTSFLESYYDNWFSAQSG
ncbi:lysophospholipid acyltransferase family protein [Alteromonas flava]|uniref:lysophospholipid acyltransferase family protein n=1 Tax=Alteromonas flava TaxID=2048003 RepID=UPI000C290253|nr:lysophospholipid acyltransferase family protein [Alteromonas flava]